MCEKIEFRTRNGELLKEIEVPPLRRDIDKDQTIEETVDSGYFDLDEPTKEAASKKKSGGGPTVVITVLLLAGIGWVVMKIRSSKRAAAL